MSQRSAAQGHTTLQVPPEDRERLEQIARDLGYTQTRGAGAYKLGSISALMRAIAVGELRLVADAERTAIDSTQRKD